MKRILILTLIFILLFQAPVSLGSSYQTIPKLNKLKGICVRVDELTKRGIDNSLKEISNYGYNAIFVLTKTPEGQVTFPSKKFPVFTNALPQIIGSARKYSLKVYAYFPVMMDKYYGTIHPEDLMGNLGYEKNTYYISLLSKNYISYIKLFLSELLQYDIDGIVFDYIRYPNGSYDFSNAFISYGTSAGIDMDYVKNIAYKTFIKPADWKTMFTLYEQGDNDILKWVNLREKVLKDVATELKNYAQQLKPNLKFGAFLVSRGYRFDLIKNAPSIKKSYAYQKVNFAYFGDTFNGILDFVIPMVYLSNLEETPDYATVVANKIKVLTKGNLEVFIGINPDSISYSDTELEVFNSYISTNGAVLFRHPLFNFGDISFKSTLKEGSAVSYTVKNNLGEERSETTIFSDIFIPKGTKEVIVNHFYKFYALTFTVGDKSYLVNNEPFSMDVAPIIKDSRTFVPIRFLAEALGFKVSYISKTRSVVIEDNCIVLKIGSKDYTVSGNTFSMDVAPFIENSRTYVPLRFVMEALGFKVGWDEIKRKIDIEGIIRID
ncbi:stalk domain-containing protein [Caldisericum exile]|uniref:Copper amine oxidase-like N-terminal domain-containing protein n=1 Tax=Caldisericum exile (strain DSM 21853 / NBRC 104410 / AZM16c01) TaxID=511051 RepID=A0A7U6GDR6_CALEA|nr:stalk domain-containing protein [Caldisericum exile]BAL80491.1 hypothetical protein CSE_03650 [Caldisericum exile AZM16c01]